jgi:diketogulonate reductase-like aldo/keto reductase
VKCDVNIDFPLPKPVKGTILGPKLPKSGGCRLRRAVQMPSFGNRDSRPLILPSIIYGTAWKEDRTRALTSQAIGTGFRAFDTANQRKHYVEEAVGAAIQDALSSGVVTREDIFIQTKFTYPGGQDHRIPYNLNSDVRIQVRQSLLSSLRHLGVTRIDSYLLHGPSRRSGLGLVDLETWRAMENAVDEKLVSALGISNVCVDQLAALLSCARIRPTFVQNRCYAAAHWDEEVRTLCRAESIVYQGFALISGNRSLLQTPYVRSIAKRHGKTAEQLIYRIAIQLGIVPLTGTTNSAHMREALDVLGFTLPQEDINILLSYAVPRS